MSNVTPEIVAAYKDAFRSVFDKWLNDELPVPDKEIGNMATTHALGVVLAAKDAEIEAAHAESNRLRGLIEEAVRCLDGEPEYHSQGMGCGLEDRGITDRYDAMSHGWEQAMERVYSENIAWAKDALASALKEKADV